MRKHSGASEPRSYVGGRPCLKRGRVRSCLNRICNLRDRDTRVLGGRGCPLDVVWGVLHITDEREKRLRCGVEENIETVGRDSLLVLIVIRRTVCAAAGPAVAFISAATIIPAGGFSLVAFVRLLWVLRVVVVVAVMQAERVPKTHGVIQDVRVAVERLRIGDIAAERVGRQPAALRGGIAPEGRGVK